MSLYYLHVPVYKMCVCLPRHHLLRSSPPPPSAPRPSWPGTCLSGARPSPSALSPPHASADAALYSVIRSTLGLSPGCYRTSLRPPGSLSCLPIGSRRRRLSPPPPVIGGDGRRSKRHLLLPPRSAHAGRAPGIISDLRQVRKKSGEHPFGERISVT